MGRGQLNRSPGAYLGVTAPTPSNTVVLDRAPTTKDYLNFSLGDFWLDQPNQDLFILVSKANGAGTWLTLGGQAGDVNDFRTDDGNIVVPNAGRVDVAGGDNMNTTGAVASTITINLNDWIDWPATATGPNAGQIQLDNALFMHAFGTNNTFLGSDAGNVTLTTSVNNTGIGAGALQSLTTGDDNVAVGFNAGNSVTVGSDCVYIGPGS